MQVHEIDYHKCNNTCDEQAIKDFLLNQLVKLMDDLKNVTI
jgi:hypothetical protein